MFKEFKKFISKGNIIDLAIGVVIGGAFQKIVNSLVEDIIMPCISILTGKIDFADMVIQVGGASIKYGKFITTAINFLIIAFAIFLVIRYINKLNDLKYKNLDKLVDKIDKTGKLKKLRDNDKTKTSTEPDTKICPYCLTEIKYKAIRCPNCTSILDKDLTEDNSTLKDESEIISK